MNQEFTLQVGEFRVLQRAFFGRTWAVAYAGMPNDRTWSIAVIWGQNHQSAAFNLFLPLDQQAVSFGNGRLVALSISAREIRLRYEA